LQHINAKAELQNGPVRVRVRCGQLLLLLLLLYNNYEFIHKVHNSNHNNQKFNYIAYRYAKMNEM